MGLYEYITHDKLDRRKKVYIGIALFWLLALLSLLYPQQQSTQGAKGTGFIPAYRISSKKDPDFKLNFIYFNKIISNNQEYLRVSFQLENLTNRDIELKLVTIAYYETIELLDLKKEFVKSIIKPFQRKVITFYDVYPKGKDGKDIVPLVDTHGNPVKPDFLIEPHGKPLLEVNLVPPYQPQDGTNGKSFVIPKYDYQKLVGGTVDFVIYHLSKYRRDYYFFNNYGIFIYDNTGKILRFKELYGLKTR